MKNGNDEETVTGIDNTSEDIIPGDKGGEEAEEAAGLGQLGVGVTFGIVVQVAQTQEEEDEIDGEEEREEGDG